MLKINKYNKQLFTRRSVVQFVYQNMFNFQSLNEVKADNEFFHICDEALFDLLVLNINLNWETVFDQVNEILKNDYDKFVLSKMFYAILISAFVDLQLKQHLHNKKQIIFEYIKIAEMFIKDDKKILNAVLSRI